MRRKFLIITLLIMFVAVLVAAKEIEATASPERPDRYTLHEVQKGETLWGISKQYMPGVDPRLGVQWIREANHMPRDYVIQPGDLLNVPCDDGELVEPLGPEYSSKEAAEMAERELQRLLNR